MRTWALVPFKGVIADAKTRLAGAMKAASRRDLVLAMATDVLTTLASTPEVARVVLVTSAADDDLRLAMPGITIFNPMPARGLNQELERAAAWAASQGASHILIAHADLPAVTAPALRAFLTPPLAPGALRIAASKEGTGTNVLLSAAPLPVALVFGTNSLAAFRRTATDHGVALDIRHEPALATDVDELADIVALTSAHEKGKLVGTATANWLSTFQEIESRKEVPVCR